MAKLRSAIPSRHPREDLNQGVAHQRTGRFVETSASYNAILKVPPDHTDALHVFGVVARERGDLLASERLIRQVIRSRPSISTFHDSLGHTLELLCRSDEAVESCRRASSLDPQNLAALQRLDIAIGERGEPKDTGERNVLYEALQSRSPERAAAHYNRGCHHQRSGALTSAIACYRTAIASQPTHFESHFNLAAALFQEREFADAAASYRQAASLRPEDPEVHYSLGVVLQTMGEEREAMQAYVRALRIDPDLPIVLCNLGGLCVDMGDPQTAKGFLLRSVELDSTKVSTHCNLAGALVKLGDPAAALESFRSALAIDPAHALTLCNLGTLLEVSFDDSEAAAQCYRLALASHPESQLAQFYLSLQHLMTGDFAAGWQGYEARWCRPEFRGMRPPHLFQPQWRGEEIRGSRIVIYREQGFGDTFQFVRYIPMVVALGATIVLKVQPSLVRLLSSNLSGAVKVVSTEADDGADAEWQCPLLSLPLAFGTELATIPGDVPYLQADPTLAETWSKRLPADALRVGLVWAGNPSHTRDKQRSIALEDIGRLAQLQRITFYSLQIGAATQELAATSLPIADLTGHIVDFADTAAMVANLDLVLCVDTAVAHLAGAMGKPVWLLVPYVPDWRWMRGRTDSPWYPSMRLFRQTTMGRWDNVLEQVEQELRAMTEAHRPCLGSTLADRKLDG